MNHAKQFAGQGKLSRIPAVVLSCLGAPEADLNVVRSLGSYGVPVILLSEYTNAPASASKYCYRTVVAPMFTQRPDRLFDALQALYEELGVKPVVFPTADTDLHALLKLTDRINEVAISSVIDSGLTARLTDKSEFHKIADEYKLPVPKTVPIQGDSVEQALQRIMGEIDFPLILKPANPTAWHDPSLPDEFVGSKAMLVENKNALECILRQLGSCLENTLIQEFIPGDDAEHYDVHIYMGRDGKAKASYCGRKIRIYPPHAGSGCYVESVREQVLEEQAINMLQLIRYRGLANINYKRHAQTGTFRLFEINPRVSQWSILAMRSEVNLPLYAYCDALEIGMPDCKERQYGLRYINERNDLRAFKTYWREGSWTFWKYMVTWLWRPLIMQFWNLEDLGPVKLVVRKTMAERLWSRSQSDVAE